MPFKMPLMLVLEVRAILLAEPPMIFQVPRSALLLLREELLC